MNRWIISKWQSIATNSKVETRYTFYLYFSLSLVNTIHKFTLHQYNHFFFLPDNFDDFLSVFTFKQLQPKLDEISSKSLLKPDLLAANPLVANPIKYFSIFPFSSLLKNND